MLPSETAAPWHEGLVCRVHLNPRGTHRNLLVLAAGSVPPNPSEVLGSIAHHWHLNIGPLPSQQGEDALWVSRFPRIVLCILVGAALGAGGCLACAVHLATDGVVVAVDGMRVRTDAVSLCVHGDSPGAVAMARAVRDALVASGVEIQAPW